MTIQDAPKRGKLMYVAEFLTSFQEFFDGGQKKGPISIENLENALLYRKKLHQHQQLENDVLVLRTDENLTEDQIKEWESRLEESQTSLSASTFDSDKALHELLQRFELWSTQALADSTLTYCFPYKAASHAHRTGDKFPERICCSPLLNIPGAHHFLPMIPHEETDKPDPQMPNSLFRPPSEKKDHACALGLAPNAWTWQEYLRICNMVTLLRDPMQASRSPLTAASPALIGQRKEELKMAESTELKPADLVALWVRAQRNTNALLHLLHLFKITEVPVEESDEDMSESADKDTRDVNSDSTTPRYVAHYIGNHKKTRKRVQSIATLLDRLVEWVVTNQACYTYRYIREGIRQEKMPSTKKRPLHKARYRDNETKKRKAVSTEREYELLQACQCYVLRWFARRNRKVTSILFTSKQMNHVSLFPYEDLVQKLYDQKVPTAIKAHLKKESDSSSDRTFSRIDRRVRIGKFKAAGVKSFRETVVSLLKSLACCSPSDILAKSDINAACEDFEYLCQTFFDGKDPAESARLLLDVDSETNKNLIDVIASFPAPWEDRCSVCDVASNHDEFICCDCCDKVFHKKCTQDFESRGLIELARSYPPLAKMLALEPLDFRPAKFEWTQMTLTVKKNVGPGGKPQRLGLGICHTEDCEDAMNNILSGSNRWSEMRWSKLYPLKVGHQGIVIVDVMDGEAGKAAGILAADIVTEIGFLRDGTLSEHYILKDLTDEERLAKFKRETDQFVLTLQRPRFGLLALSRQWLGRARQCSRLFTDARQRRSPNVVRCSRCRGRTEMSRDEEHILAEARFCKSLIRSLGMESYTLPFHDESSQLSDTNRHASFRRLDAMMDYILLTNAPVARKETVSVMGNPFKPPPWARKSLSCRLSWATPDLEQRPIELLCKGIEVLAIPSDPVQPWTNDELALLHRFVVVFCARFLMDTEASLSIPSSLALSTPSPWVKRSCVVCRSTPETTNTAHVCDSEACRQLMNSWTNNSSDQNNNKHCSLDSCNDSPWDAGFETVNCRNAVVKEYDENSSLVGTSLLLLPGDPVLQLVSRELNQSIDHADRPVVFIVASYLPYPYCDEEPASSDQSVCEGIFHLLPVLTDSQLTFLESTYEMRRFSEANKENKSWADLRALRLEGVVRMGASDLTRKLKETASIREVIDATVGAVAYASSAVDPSRDCDVKDLLAGLSAQKASAFSTLSLRERADDSIEEHSILIDSLLRSQSSFLRNMIERMCPEDDSVNSEAVDLFAALPHEAVDTDQSSLEIEIEHEGGTEEETESESAQIDLEEMVEEALRATDTNRFPLRIRAFISEGAQTLPHVIEWIQEGEAFIIHDPRSVELADIIEKHFNHRNYSSLLRQLTMYGWKKDSTGKCNGAFRHPQFDHPQFHRDNSPSQLALVRWRSSRRSSNTMISQENAAEEPAADGDDVLRVSASETKNALTRDTEALSLSEKDHVSDMPHASDSNSLRVGVDPVPLPQPPSFVSPHMAPVRNAPPARSHDVIAGNAARQCGNGAARFLMVDDLYKAGLPGTILTVVESACLCEAHVRNHDVLGLRLLIPRYTLPVARQQQQLVLQGNSSMIPRLQPAIWQYILGADYERSKTETGAPLLHEGKFHYRIPTQKFPLDRVAESFLVELAGRTTQTGLSSSSQRFEAQVLDLTGGSSAPSVAFQATSTPHDEEGSVNRIRGGGPSIENDRDGPGREQILLVNTPKTTWQNTLVKSICETTQEGELTGEATFLGVVQGLPDIDEEGEGVPFSVFYVSSVGYLEDVYTITSIAPDQIYLVQEGSEDARIASQWGRLSELMTSSQGQVVSDDDHVVVVSQDAKASISSKDGVDRWSSSPQVYEMSQTITTMKEAALQLSHCLCQKSHGPTVIGVLPDGRALLWLRSDPSALYVRKPANDASALMSYVRGNPHSDKRLFCPWGCVEITSVESDESACLFSNPSKLREHLLAEHEFGVPESIVQMRSGSLARVGEGTSILTLSSQLKSTICRRCPGLRGILERPPSKTVTAEMQMLLDLNEVLGLVRPTYDEEAVPNIVRSANSPEVVRRLLLLWSIIARLFAVESDYFCRLEPHEWEEERGSSEPENLSSLIGITDSSIFRASGCVLEESNTCLSGDRDFRCCGLCCPRLETLAHAEDSAVETNGTNATTSFTVRAANCSLLCQLCLPNYSSGSISRKVGSGLISVARALLIRIAKSVPTGLRREVTTHEGFHSSKTDEGYLWESGNYQNWRYILEKSRETKSFYQAMVVLIKSINTSKLPRWWKGAREGWASAFVTMGLQSFSGLFLHLYALDAAVSEFMVSYASPFPRKDIVPEALKGLSVEEQMKKALEWAKVMNYPTFEGEASDDCLVCDDGGDLICCEFCKNSQHAACCQPPIGDPEKLEAWVCPPCIADLSALVG